MKNTRKGAGVALQWLGSGRYELLSILGQGGMAAVWRARDHQNNEDIAVKILHPEVAERRSYRSRFLAEARTMRRMRHPSVLRVFDLGEDEGRPWFTMEIVDGGALIDRLEARGKVPPLETLDIHFQLLQALQMAHLAGIVHRDVKPDNVLIGNDGQVRLSDFGIARIRNERVDHKTRTGVAMGTVGYMSPEQRENARDVGAGADLYATGATLYATITGCEPPDLFAAHLEPKLLDPIPPAIRDVVKCACAYRPENRYPSARAMAEAIAAARDAIARGEGEPERAGEWMARFDRLIDEARAAQVDPEPPPAPSEQDLPVEKGDGATAPPSIPGMALDRESQVRLTPLPTTSTPHATPVSPTPTVDTPPTPGQLAGAVALVLVVIAFAVALVYTG